jgi:hypothetical protein
MKRVYLLRHAKSRRKDRSLADRDWPLAGRGGGPRARLPMISGRRGFGPSSCCAHLRSGPGRHSSVSRAPSGSGRGDLRGRADRRERGGAAALSSRAPPGGRLGWSLGVAGSGPAGLPRCSRTGVGSASVREGALALLGGNHRDGQAERLHAMGEVAAEPVRDARRQCGDDDRGAVGHHELRRRLRHAPITCGSLKGTARHMNRWPHVRAPQRAR